MSYHKTDASGKVIPAVEPVVPLGWPPGKGKDAVGDICTVDAIDAPSSDGTNIDLTKLTDAEKAQLLFLKVILDHVKAIQAVTDKLA